MNLAEAAAEFNARMLQDNPASAITGESKLVAFVQHLQTQATDVSSWSEDNWLDAIAQFGVTDFDDACELLESVASWGMVDNFVWESPEDVLAKTQEER